MAVCSPQLPIAADQRLPSSISSHDEKKEPADNEYGPLYVVDDLLRSCAADKHQVPLIAYPKSELGLTDFEYFTAQDLDQFTDTGVRHLQAAGLKFVPDAPVIALLGPSSLEYLITVFSLTRLGYAILFLSNRLALEAYLSLIEKTNCQGILYSPQFFSVVNCLQQSRDILAVSMLTRKDFTLASTTFRPLIHNVSRTPQPQKIAFIIHSSGSTGVPKPIFQTHSACLNNYSVGFNRRTVTTLPLYHNFGLANTYRSMFNRKEIFYYNVNLPQTGKHLTQVMELARPGILCAVPYTLKLLGESEAGIKTLKDCDIVLSGGSACPDDLGERLVEQGVNLVVQFGATEIGQLMSSMRPNGDKAWNYLRVLPHIKPFVLMDPVGNNVFELVVLDGWKSKVASNSDDPPNSFRTRDTFTPHPTIPDAWRHVGRLDDRITLMNGEKVLPLPIEGRVKEEDAVKECVAFGVGKAYPGLLVFRSITALDLEDDEFIDRIWPAVQDANSKTDSFSQISRDMIIPSSREYPQTDKGTAIRARVYKDFAQEIEQIYTSQDDGKEGTLKLNQAAIVELILENLESLDVKVDDVEADLFSAGIDSLKAIALWGLLRRKLDLGGRSKDVSQAIVFERGSVASLASFLYSLSHGIKEENDTHELVVMKDLVAKYSLFQPEEFPKLKNFPEKHSIVLTGATGSLGAHILAQLLAQPNVLRVWCLVRADNLDIATTRVRTALEQRKILHRTGGSSECFENKAVCVPADLSQRSLGLTVDILGNIRSSATAFIHCAWAVNFILGVRSFERQHIAGLHNLLTLTLESRLPAPPEMIFCSSISSVGGISPPGLVPESLVHDFHYAQNTGYGRSKFVAEQLVHAAASKGANARVLRIGQIVGDTRWGIWNDSEAIPLMIRSALTIGALPALPERPSWISVDTLASVILELAGILNLIREGITPKSLLLNNVGAKEPDLVYNVLNPVRFSWTEDLIPLLKKMSLCFETVSVQDWLKRLKKGEQDPQKNPPIKLLQFWEDKYAHINNDAPCIGLQFKTARLLADSTTMRKAPELQIEKYISNWLPKWTT